MLRFKQFIKLQKEKIPVAIVTHSKQKIPVAIVTHSLKNKPSIKESIDNELHNELSSQYEYDPDEIKELRRYADDSFNLNASLLGKHHYNEPATTIGSHNVSVLDRALDRPLGRSLVTYSGLGFDPRKLSRNGRIHLPSYTSSSLSKSTASGFAGEYSGTKDGKRHVLQLHLDQNNLGGYLGDHGNSEEREFLLPRNSTVQIHHSEEDPDNPNLMIHHASVSHDTHPDDVERDPNSLLGLHKNFHGRISRSLQPDNASHFNALLETARKSKSTELLNKINSGNLDDDDLDNDFEDKHRDALLSRNDSKSHYMAALLANRYKIKLEPHHISSIVNNPESHDAIDTLMSGTHYTHLIDNHLNTIVNNPNANHAHYILIKDHVDSISNGTSDGRLSDEHVNTIINNKDSIDAHGEILRKHLVSHLDDDKHKIPLSDEHIQTILGHHHINNPIGTYLTGRMLTAHQRGVRPLTDAHISALVKNANNNIIVQSKILHAHNAGHIKLNDEDLNRLKSL